MKLENYYEESVELYCLTDFVENTTTYYALTDSEAKKIYDFCENDKCLCFSKLDPDFFDTLVKYAGRIFI